VLSCKSWSVTHSDVGKGDSSKALAARQLPLPAAVPLGRVQTQADPVLTCCEIVSSYSMQSVHFTGLDGSEEVSSSQSAKVEAGPQSSILPEDVTDSIAGQQVIMPHSKH